MLHVARVGRSTKEMASMSKYGKHGQVWAGGAALSFDGYGMPASRARAIHGESYACAASPRE
jgi:hypothetical protein